MSGVYSSLVVESFLSDGSLGHVNQVHIRPVVGQTYPSTMMIECSRKMVNTDVYPIGTKFRLRVRLKQKIGCKPHLYSYHQNPIDVLSDDDAAKLIFKTG